MTMRYDLILEGALYTQRKAIRLVELHAPKVIMEHELNRINANLDKYTAEYTLAVKYEREDLIEIYGFILVKTLEAKKTYENALKEVI